MFAAKIKNKKLFNSIKKNLFILPENTLFIPGHGEKTTKKKELYVKSLGLELCRKENDENSN